MTFEEYLKSIGWEYLDGDLSKGILALMRHTWDHQQKEIDIVNKDNKKLVSLVEETVCKLITANKKIDSLKLTIKCKDTEVDRLRELASILRKIRVKNISEIGSLKGLIDEHNKKCDRGIPANACFSSDWLESGKLN